MEMRVAPAGTALILSSTWHLAPAVPRAEGHHRGPRQLRDIGSGAITNEVHTSVAAAVLHSDKAAQYMAKATAKIPADACGKPANLCP